MLHYYYWCPGIYRYLFKYKLVSTYAQKTGMHQHDCNNGFSLMREPVVVITAWYQQKLNRWSQRKAESTRAGSIKNNEYPGWRGNSKNIRDWIRTSCTSSGSSSLNKVVNTIVILDFIRIISFSTGWAREVAIIWTTVSNAGLPYFSTRELTSAVFLRRYSSSSIRNSPTISFHTGKLD